MNADEWRVVKVVTKRRQYLVTADSLEEACELVDTEEGGDGADVVEAVFIGVYTLLVV